MQPLHKCFLLVAGEITVWQTSTESVNSPTSTKLCMIYCSVLRKNLCRQDFEAQWTSMEPISQVQNFLVKFLLSVSWMKEEKGRTILEWFMLLHTCAGVTFCILWWQSTYLSIEGFISSILFCPHNVFCKVVLWFTEAKTSADKIFAIQAVIIFSCVSLMFYYYMYI